MSGLDTPALASTLPDAEERSTSSWTVFALGVLVLGAMGIAPTPHIEHQVFAYAMLHGQLYIEDLGIPIHEAVVARDHLYTLHPPLAAFVCLPFVALFGFKVNQVLISLLVGGLDILLCWKMLGYLIYEQRIRLAILGFFVFGTVFSYEASLGASWGMCAIVSLAPTFAALTLFFSEEYEPWQIGLLAGIACLARYDLVLLVPFYAFLIWNDRGAGTKLKGFGLALLPSLAIYVILNELRFGTLTDIGLWLWYQDDIWAGAKVHPGLGPFNVAYLPFNLFTAVFMGPGFQTAFPWYRPQAAGQALLLTSPALLLALRASWRRVETWLLWGMVLVGMSACLLVWSNGVEQFGARYWIQVLPFLIALIALGWREDFQLNASLISLSILFTMGGLTIIRMSGGLVHR